MATDLQVTATNKTPLLQIIVWILLASGTVSVLCRIYTKRAVIKVTGIDDLFVAISLVSTTALSLLQRLTDFRTSDSPDRRIRSCNN